MVKWIGSTGFNEEEFWRSQIQKEVKSGDGGIYKHEYFCFIFEVHVKSCNVCPSSYIQDFLPQKLGFGGPCPLGREDNFEIMSFHREKRFISISPRLQTGTCRNMKRKMQFLNGEKKGRRAALHRHTLGSVGKACRDLGPFPHPFCMDHCMPFDMVSREKATSRLNPKLRWHWGTG